MPTKNLRARRRTLASGRPLRVKPPLSVSRKATRTLIRRHHNLEKRRAQAVAAGDNVAALEIAEQIEHYGGIKSYQQASLLGQANDRGGDSSKVLMNWLQSVKAQMGNRCASDRIEREGKLRMLEVGALSTSNACSKSGYFEIERIDLNSQVEGIIQQDFMERPLPTEPSGQFDIISLSLVLNYVPDAASRGDMLLRTLKFLRNTSLINASQGVENFFPCLFLVLPASCVTNSRYLNEDRLEMIMQSLGYANVHKKLSTKLAYYLWRATTLSQNQTDIFKKVRVRAGKTRNNFAIVIK